MKQKFLPLIITILFFSILACSLPGLAGGRASSDEAPDIGMLGPNVIIQQPQPGADVSKGDSLFFSVLASDDAGVIRIDLLVNGKTVVSQSSLDANGDTPLLLNYPLVATDDGTHAIIARAYDAQGLMGESPVYYVNVLGAGSVSEQSLGEYTVKEGETLESIAQNAGVSVVDIGC